MPDRDVAFMALDEAQLGADLERGHVFTDRLLHRRGRDETMILGSEALKPMIRALVPDAEIIARPRFSTLTYAGAKKISRLPKRSAIVAFSAEEVYAVAEMLRRLRGGAAVVMGALSPRTRNAQVEMFQAGEVDYLVATDAIGMGLNMDVAHVAFAGLHKFDGRRRRRLTVAEMAQIAGRAGRHHRDGTFGALAEEGPDSFLPEEVLAIEEHRFPRLDHLYWREGDPDLSSIDALIGSLERKPAPGVLRAAPSPPIFRCSSGWPTNPGSATGCGGPPWSPGSGRRAAFPISAKWASIPHARFVSRVFGHLSEGLGHVPHQWFADEIARLDNMAGDVETLAGRLSAIRSWAYIAQRADWLADPRHWAERTREIEERLSDGLHASLTQRFVDKRTTALIRRIGADAGALPVTIGPEGEVLVEDHPIGRLEGFRFTVEAGARANDKRLLLAAAEKRLGTERSRRAETLIAAGHDAFSLVEDRLVWDGHGVARLIPGPSLGRPVLRLERDLDCLAPIQREQVKARLDAWLARSLDRQLPALVRLAGLAREAKASPAIRAVAAALEDAGGIAPRQPLRLMIDALSPEERRRLRGMGITIGTLDVFDPRLLKPGAAAWRRILMACGARRPTWPGRVPPSCAATSRGAVSPRAIGRSANRRCGSIWSNASPAPPMTRARGAAPSPPTPRWRPSIGLEAATLDRLMGDLGFRKIRAGKMNPPAGSGAAVLPPALPRVSPPAPATPSPRLPTGGGLHDCTPPISDGGDGIRMSSFPHRKDRPTP